MRYSQVRHSGRQGPVLASQDLGHRGMGAVADDCAIDSCDLALNRPSVL